MLMTPSQRKKFTVHKALLKNTGSYWADNDAFESDLGKKGIIILKDENPEAWNLFAKWLYTGMPIITTLLAIF